MTQSEWRDEWVKAAHTAEGEDEDEDEEEDEDEHEDKED
jgi:hypothetical protein